jgi:hypothetical protein
MSVLEWSILAARLAVSGVAAASVLLAYRVVRRRCPRCARLLALGIIARAAVGLSAFWISYARIPILPELQLGPGFWDLAPDAETYYESALAVLDGGVGVVNWERGSPVHIVILAGWMAIVGVSPAAALFLNLVAYVWTSALLVNWFAPQRSGDATPALVALLGFSISPALVLHGSQPLKDELFLYMIVASTLAGAVALKGLMSAAPGARAWARGVGATAIICVAVYLMAGIRTYYPPLLLSGLGVAIIAGVGWVPRRDWGRYAVAAVAVLVVVTASYLAGAGSLFRLFLESGVDRMRQGFIASPSGTSLSTAKLPPPRSNEPAILEIEPEPRSYAASGGVTAVASPVSPTAGVAAPPTVWDVWIRVLNPSEFGFRIRATLKGLLATFVPISLLLHFGAVDFAGGRGLLLVTDMDTIFMNLSLVLVAWVCWTRRSHLRRNWPLAMMLLVPTVGLALLQAYVVTNFGSLFRMRVIMVATAWLLPLTLVTLPDRRLTD